MLNQVIDAPAWGYVGVHNVMGNNYHTSIVFYVDKNSKYYNEKDFLNFEGSTEIKYATIGAGPQFPGSDKLIAGVNRDKDKDLSNKVQYIPISVNDEKIDISLQLVKNYNKNNINSNYSIDYDLWPDSSDGYNSNSFTSGLLNEAGFYNVPTPHYNVPGWAKP